MARYRFISARSVSKPCQDTVAMFQPSTEKAFHFLWRNQNNSKRRNCWSDAVNSIVSEASCGSPNFPSVNKGLSGYRLREFNSALSRNARRKALYREMDTILALSSGLLADKAAVITVAQLQGQKNRPSQGLCPQ